MAGIPRLAWRNLGRNRRRTLSTGAALAFGISLCVASYGLMDGLNADLLQTLTKLDLGHAQIHQRDFAEHRKLEHALTGAADALAVAEKQPGVQAAAARTYAYALVSAGTKSSGVEIVGVDPVREPKVTVLHERVVQGRYLDEQPTPWQRGRKLSAEEQATDEALTDAAEDEALDEIDGLGSLDEDDAEAGEAKPPVAPSDGAEPAKPADGSEPAAQPDAAPTAHATAAPAVPADEAASAQPSATASSEPPADPRPSPQQARPPPKRDELTRKLALAIAPPPDRPPRVFVGASLAKVLGVGVGEPLYVTAQTVDGSAESVFLEVAGIYKTGSQLYDRHRLYMHLTDAQRLVHLDGRPHEIAMVMASSKQATELAAALGQQLSSTELVVRSWNQIRPDIQQMLDLNSASMGLMMFIIFIVATLGVVNTMLMAVFERTRELGVLKAIGMSGRKIIALIVTETLFLVLASSLVGTALGLGLDLYMVYLGVDLSWLTAGISFGGLGVDPVLHGAITAEGLIMPTVILSITCLIASIYPARRAAKLQPAVGMRET